MSRLRTRFLGLEIFISFFQKHLSLKRVYFIFSFHTWHVCNLIPKRLALYIRAVDVSPPNLFVIVSAIEPMSTTVDAVGLLLERNQNAP